MDYGQTTANTTSASTKGLSGAKPLKLKGNAKVGIKIKKTGRTMTTKNK